MSVPVRIGHRVLGTLNVYRELGHRFDADALALATNLADQAGIAIENARLFEEAERRRRAAESFAEVGRDHLAVSRPARGRGANRRECPPALRRQRGLPVSHRCPDRATWSPSPCPGPLGPGWHAGVRLPRGTGASGVAVRDRRPVLSDDILNDPRIPLTEEIRDRLPPVASPTVLAVPIMFRDQAIGALSIGRSEDRPFQADEIRMAQAFAEPGGARSGERPGGGGAPRGEGGRGSGQPGQERVRREHEPRDPDAHERHHGDDRSSCWTPSSTPSSASISRW